MSSSINLPPSFETSKFGEPDGQKNSVKHSGRHCNQPRETKGKKKENTPIVMTGPKKSLRGPTHQYCQPQSRSYISDPHNHLQQDNFTLFGESYASLFQRLVQQGMITPLLGYTPDLHSRNFDPNVRCAYHSDAQGHSTEDCRTLKREIEKIIQDKLIVVQNIGPSTIPQSSSPARGTA
ncbi:hypothetical protein P3L10_014337 [Capsicum annuum]